MIGVLTLVVLLGACLAFLEVRRFRSLRRINAVIQQACSDLAELAPGADRLPVAKTTARCAPAWDTPSEAVSEEYSSSARNLVSLELLALERPRGDYALQLALRAYASRAATDSQLIVAEGELNSYTTGQERSSAMDETLKTCFRQGLSASYA
jgi:hypothetical protein